MFSSLQRLLVILSIGMLGGQALVDAMSQQTLDRMPEAAIREFQWRVGQYATLHGRLEGPLPPPGSSQRARTLQLNRTFLAAAIKAARPHAAQGDIFTPVIGQSFRNLIAGALKQDEMQSTWHGLIGRDTPTQTFHSRVYDSCSDWAAAELPVSLLNRLPTLPEDIEYRLVARDLILCDVHADLIIDILSNVISPSTT